jgi:hypothetical protein
MHGHNAMIRGVERHSVVSNCVGRRSPCRREAAAFVEHGVEASGRNGGKKVLFVHTWSGILSFSR